jgi:hypothetical protein
MAAFCRMVGAGNEIILSAQGMGTNGIFHAIVVYLQMAMQGIGVHLVHKGKAYAMALPIGLWGSTLGIFCKQPRFDPIQE